MLMISLAKYQSLLMTKMASKETSTLKEEALQSDLDQIARLANQKQMICCLNRCKVSYFRNNNSLVQCVMNGRHLSAVSKENYLGIPVSSDLKSSLSCSQEIKTPKYKVSLIGRVFHNK